MEYRAPYVIYSLQGKVQLYLLAHIEPGSIKLAECEACSAKDQGSRRTRKE